MDTINYINVNGTTYEISGNIDTSTLMLIAITLPSIPNVTTLSYNDTLFSVGDIVRVADSNSDTGYTFYRLHKISDNKAYWTKLDTGTVIDDAVITVTMNHNQTGTFTSGSATISYTYNNESITDTLTGNQVLFLVPAGISYTISFSTVNGYATPSNITGTTAAFGRPTHTVSYDTEIVTVSTSMNGATLYIDNVEYTQPVNIPYGTTYTVSGSDILGYKTTALTFTAELASRTVTVVYEELVYGVFAYYSDGSLRSYDDADTNAIGVAVLDENCSFVIDKLATNSDDTIRYGGYNKDLSNISVVVTNNATTAILDFAGEENTTKIINALAGVNDGYVIGAPACLACRAAFSGNGYMGSLGEWSKAFANKASIDSMMAKIGGTAINSNYHWTSTLYNASTHSWLLVWGNGRSDYYDRNIRYCVRAFRAL